MRLILDKLKESCLAVLPISVIVAILGFFVVKVDTSVMIKFLICAVIMIIGLTIFSIGVDRSMIEIGEHIGSATSKSKKIIIMTIISLLVGFLITVAEPDLKVLSTQFPGLSSPMVLTLIVAAGSGIFLTLAVLRVMFKVKLNIILGIAYGTVCILSFFVPKSYAPIAFDSSGISTGSLSVPFLIAFGLGISAVRSTNSQDDSFGLVSIVSAGPIIAIMIFSLFAKPAATVATDSVVIETISNSKIFENIGVEFVANLKDVAIVLIPICVIFFAFQFFKLHLPTKEIVKILIGLVFTYIGMVFFLSGIQAGFLPIGGEIGLVLGQSSYNWVLIPLSLIIGLFIVLAEPSVHVLNKQVEELTGGVIKKSVMLVCMCIGVSLSVCLAVIRCYFEINILWFIVPMLIACIVLGFFVPTIFCGIGFDSGGVASGSMAAAFILPFINGVCQAFGVNSLYYGFGTLAIIGVMPTVVVESLGLIFSIVSNRKQTAKYRKVKKSIKIIDFDYGE